MSSATYQSSSYYYSTATSSTKGTSTSGHRYATSSHTDPSGTTIVRTAHQDLGEPAIVSERRYDRTGQELATSTISTSTAGFQRIADLTDEDYNYNVTSTEPASVDTDNNQDYSLQENAPQDTMLSATNSPADDYTGIDGEQYQGDDVDEGAIDPVTGKRYYSMP
ncbi:hypothetical protein BGW36DRAFT_429895 [Talaromyces proteolyticus]|uniref:Uncharacterized protein n=1 Tax=Talaromyces proteolyticus TaxID=1131652 RepID=A0AAD4PXN5_9EURO|nr:uncharacterized protein BGW36DRAFT_429895 [Talaromyces proteolyticus]KAH8693865.1 hypothetical protein BGW36DRAFT_429895 [Talaromyces proteolyticus]